MTTIATERNFRCSDDRYDDGFSRFTSPDDFVTMVRCVFGDDEADQLVIREDEVLDANGVVLLRDYPRA